MSLLNPHLLNQHLPSMSCLVIGRMAPDIRKLAQSSVCWIKKDFIELCVLFSPSKRQGNWHNWQRVRLQSGRSRVQISHSSHGSLNFCLNKNSFSSAPLAHGSVSQIHAWCPATCFYTWVLIGNNCAQQRHIVGSIPYWQRFFEYGTC